MSILKKNITRASEVGMRSVGFLVICGLFMVFVVAGLLTFFGFPMPRPSTSPINDGRACGIDFTMRVNEVECLKRGVNPFSVWNKEVKLSPYKPFKLNEPENNISDDEYAYLAAYMPWEYALMLPFSFLPLWVWWYIYLIIDLAIISCVMKRAYSLCFDIFHSRLDGLFGCCMLSFLVYPFWDDLRSGNFTILIIGAIFAMCHCLNRRKDVLAGLLWAFIMVKPQYGLIFSVPLLLRKKFLTVAVAVVACLGLSIIPSAMCHTSVIDLALQVKTASMSGFRPCALVPAIVVDMLAKFGFSESAPVYLGLGIGAVVCTALTLKMLFVRDWFVIMLPSIVTAVSWSYILDHGYALCALPVLLASIYYIRYDNRMYKMSFVLGLAFVCRFYNLAVNVGRQCNGILPWLNLPSPLYDALNSYNSLVATLFMLGFCVLLIRKRVEWLVENPAP